MAEELFVKTERLKADVEELKKALSALRKKGVDTKIADIRVMAVRPKILYAEVTKEDADLEKAVVFMQRAREEVEELKNNFAENKKPPDTIRGKRGRDGKLLL